MINRRAKLIYIIGSVIIGIIAMLIVFTGLALGGVFSDSKEKLVFSSVSKEFDYDGKKHTDDRWELVSGQLKNGHVANVEVTGTRTDAGSSENYITATITDAKGNDVSDGYEIEYQPGRISVLPRKITVSSASATKEYDGVPLTLGGAENFKVTFGELIGGHELVPYEEASIVNAGRTSNSCARLFVYDAKGKDKTDNYEITTDYGVLEITPRAISVEAHSEIKVYDGQPLTCRQLSVTSDSELVEGHEITSFDMPAEALDVGSWENYIAAVTVSDENGQDVTGNYAIDFHSGKLIVTPRPLTIRSGSSTREYDGTPLTNSAYEIVSITQLAEGHTEQVKITGERTEIGESENTIAEVKILTEDGEDVTYNYDIKKQTGVLRINEAQTSEDPPAGGGMLDDSGDIRGGEAGSEDQPPQLALKVQSETDGSIYLRYMSYGGYNGKKWGAAEEYPSLLDGRFCANYLTGAALKSAGLTSNRVSVQSLAGYYVPYYADMSQSDYQIQTSDVRYEGSTENIYTLYYYLYNYVTDGALPSSKLGFGGYTEFGQAYGEFVKERYLAVPETTANELKEIAGQFDADDPQLISKVASYVQGSATYNLKYDRGLDDAEDIVVSFLKTYKEGICQHYASAATVLYRMLGIPARYVIGFVGETEAGKWVEITSEKAHAWVEVFLDGYGWVNVEVTGGGFNGGGGSGNGENGGDDNQGEGGKFTVKPVNEYYEYDGIHSYSHSGRVQGVSEFLELGLTYKVTVSDETRRDAGKTEIRIKSFTLFDADGNDVTENYNVKIGKGYLQVYVYSVNVSTGSAVKVYDGTPLTEPTINAGSLMNGDRFEMCEAAGSQTKAGFSANTYNIKIVDKDGEDVTDTYKINADYGTLEVRQRELTIEALSAEKPFDGTALQAEGYDIVSGSIAEGHKAVVVVRGKQTKIGESVNRISSVVILDGDNNDVTESYKITTVNGLLKVTLPE